MVTESGETYRLRVSTKRVPPRERQIELWLRRDDLDMDIRLAIPKPDDSAENLADIAYLRTAIESILQLMQHSGVLQRNSGKSGTNEPPLCEIRVEIPRGRHDLLPAMFFVTVKKPFSLISPAETHTAISNAMEAIGALINPQRSLRVETL